MHTQKNNKGSVIIAAMIVALVVALLCGTYISSVISEYNNSLRSMKANMALNLAEAGIDASMYELKQKTVVGTWSSVNNENGQVAYYYKTIIANKNLGGGDFGTVKVLIEDLGNSSASPIIIAQGTVRNGNNAPVIKQVKVVLDVANEGGLAGVYSKNTINMNGQNVVFDAYDSSVGDYGGNNVLDEVTIAVLNEWAQVNLNKNTVYGKIAFVGGSTQGAAGNYSDRVGYQYDNGNGGALYGASTAVSYKSNGKMQAVFDASRVVPNLVYTLPASPAKPVNSGATAGITIYPPSNNQTLELGYASASADSPTYYYMAGNDPNNVNVNLNGTTRIHVVGPTVLVIDGALQISGNSPGIYIDKSDNASLMLFVKNNINISGQGIANNNYEADRFYLIPTGDSGQNISLGGNGAYRGVFYGPTFNANINGNGAWYGAIVANAISITGNGGFHYDTQCGKRLSGKAGYSIKQWLELSGGSSATYARDTRSVLN